jgi:hypothetical protein
MRALHPSGLWGLAVLCAACTPDRVAGPREAASAWAWHHPKATQIESAVSGIVRVDNVSDGQTVEGSVDVTFPRAGRLRTDFQARWIPRTTLLCG